MTLFFIIFISFLFFQGCNDIPAPVRSTSNIRMMDSSLIRANRNIMQSESQDIDDFIERYGWKMNTSPTGLRYTVYRQDSGPLAVKGQVAVLQFTLRFLDGSVVYKTDSLRPKEFVIGHGGVESGLEEGILLMGKGDRARFILPSHLAFGLLGDQGNIPPRAVLVYEVFLADLKSSGKPSR